VAFKVEKISPRRRTTLTQLLYPPHEEVASWLIAPQSSQDLNSDYFAVFLCVKIFSPARRGSCPISFSMPFKRVTSRGPANDKLKLTEREINFN